MRERQGRPDIALITVVAIIASAMIISIAITGAHPFSAPPRDDAPKEDTSAVEVAGGTLWSVNQITDQDARVVCWTYSVGGGSSGSISCLPFAQVSERVWEMP